MIFRVANPGDYEAIAQIYTEHIARGGATMEDRPQTAADVARWVAGFGDREGIFVLCEPQSDRVMGYGLIKKYSDRPGYRFAAETAVYLRPESTGKGYGSYVKKQLIARCKAWRYHHLVAKIFSENTASIAYNQKIGYEIVGIQREIGFKNGRWVDITIMQLLLS